MEISIWLALGKGKGKGKEKVLVLKCSTMQHLCEVIPCTPGSRSETHGSANPGGKSCFYKVSHSIGRISEPLLLVPTKQQPQSYSATTIECQPNRNLQYRQQIALAIIDNTISCQINKQGKHQQETPKDHSFSSSFCIKYPLMALLLQVWWITAEQVERKLFSAILKLSCLPEDVTNRILKNMIESVKCVNVVRPA